MSLSQLMPQSSSETPLEEKIHQEKKDSVLEKILREIMDSRREFFRNGFYTKDENDPMPQSSSKTPLEEKTLQEEEIRPKIMGFFEKMARDWNFGYHSMFLVTNGFDTKDENDPMSQSSSKTSPEEEIRQALNHGFRSGDALLVGCGGYASRLPDLNFGCHGMVFVMEVMPEELPQLKKMNNGFYTNDKKDFMSQSSSETPPEEKISQTYAVFEGKMERMILVEGSVKMQHLGRDLQKRLRCSVEEHEDAVKMKRMRLVEGSEKMQHLGRDLQNGLWCSGREHEEAMKNGFDPNDENDLMPQSSSKTPPGEEIRQNDPEISDFPEITPSKGRNHYILVMDLFPNNYKQVSPQESEASTEESEDDSDDGFETADISIDPAVLQKKFEETMNSKEYEKALDHLSDKFSKRQKKNEAQCYER